MNQRNPRPDSPYRTGRKAPVYKWDLDRARKRRRRIAVRIALGIVLMAMIAIIIAAGGFFAAAA